MQVTPEQLKALIDSDQQATALANAGNDTACAARCSAIAPKLVVKTQLSEMGIMQLYDNPADGETVLSTIETVAMGNPIVARVKRFMGPGVDPTCLPDWGLASIRAALTASFESGGLGLTPELAAPILAAAEVAQTITADDVSAAMKGVRS